MNPKILHHLCAAIALSSSVVAEEAVVETAEAEVARRVLDLKSVKMVLDVFTSDFGGSYPNEDTRKELIEGGMANKANFVDRKSSNSFMQQVLEYGYLAKSSESILNFRLLGLESIESENDGLLKVGECGLSYVKGLTKADNAKTPLLLAPMVPGKLTFDQEVFHGKAIVLFLDGSVTIFDVESDGKLKGEGSEIFSIDGAEPIGPDRIAYPLYPPVVDNK